MRKAMLISWLIASLLFLLPSSALALGGNHPEGEITPSHADWPKGVVETANFEGRVQGHWVNANDFFCFKGDAAAFRQFLALYAKVSDTPLRVVIHAGSIPLTGQLGRPPETRFDWKLEIIRRGWGAPPDPRRPKNDPGYVVTVHLWVSDNITLDQVEVPKHIDVISAGEIERFIDRHNNDR